ncbi:FHA domain [Carpediemonas membranifera]|uniref:FHA domain n=1 Tax=Carpediemonas membranifera TaxID=201153 RepID=A0A8J6E284_9EUKA|nr:FHA domain [Carpediemonas membranifera]|eukprot:KAG9397314.1 FHA domain [Carpediemonas membranifera]
MSEHLDQNVEIAAEPYGWLILKDAAGNVTKERFKIVLKEATIGRSSSCHLIIDSKKVANYHCSLFFDDLTNLFSIKNVTEDNFNVVCDGTQLPPGETMPLSKHLIVGDISFLLHPSPNFLPAHSQEEAESIVIEGTPAVIHRNEEAVELLVSPPGSVFDRFVTTPMRGLKRLLTPKAATPESRGHLSTPKSAKPSARKEEVTPISGAFFKKSSARRSKLARPSLMRRVDPIEEEDVDMEPVEEAPVEKTPLARTPEMKTPRSSARLSRLARVEPEEEEMESAEQAGAATESYSESEAEAEFVCPYTRAQLQTIKVVALRRAFSDASVATPDIHKKVLIDRIIAGDIPGVKFPELDPEEEAKEEEKPVARATKAKKTPKARKPKEAPKSTRRSARVQPTEKEEAPAKVKTPKAKAAAMSHTPRRSAHTKAPEPESSSESEDETEETLPYTMEELKALKWLELRSVCKQHGITARNKDQYLALALPRCKDGKQ